MTDENVLKKLEEIGNCQYDIQLAAIFNSLKEELKGDIKAAQKEIEGSNKINSPQQPHEAITLLREWLKEYMVDYNYLGDIADKTIDFLEKIAQQHHA